MSEIIFTITGPSGSGKTYLKNHLLGLKKPNQDPTFCEIISFTTRPKRSGEVDGKDYYFISKEEAEKKIVNKEVVEHAVVGNYIYGITRQELQDKRASRQMAVVIVDPEGLSQLIKVINRDYFIVFYIDNPLPLLYTRVLNRFTDELLDYSQSLDAKKLIETYADKFSYIADEKRQWLRRVEDMTNINMYIPSYMSNNFEDVHAEIIRSYGSGNYFN